LVLDAFHGDLTETTFPTKFEEVTQHFAGDLDNAKLKIQMQMLSTSPAVVDASIVSVNQVIDKLLSLGSGMHIFTDVAKLIHAYASLFPCRVHHNRAVILRPMRLTTFNRWTMNTGRLTQLAL